MANPKKGEIDFAVDGQDYRLQFTIDALCATEGVLDLSLSEITARLQDPARRSVTLMRGLFWGGLREHHPALALRGAGELMQRLGAESTMDLVGRALQAAFPDPQANGANPPPPGNPSGIGPAFSKAGAN